MRPRRFDDDLPCDARQHEMIRWMCAQDAVDHPERRRMRPLGDDTIANEHRLARARFRGRLTRQHVRQELFLTGTTTDVTPVVSLDGRAVGGGAPGPISRMLLDRLLERMGVRAAALATTRG